MKPKVLVDRYHARLLAAALASHPSELEVDRANMIGGSWSVTIAPYTHVGLDVE